MIYFCEVFLNYKYVCGICVCSVRKYKIIKKICVDVLVCSEVVHFVSSNRVLFSNYLVTTFAFLLAATSGRHKFYSFGLALPALHALPDATLLFYLGRHCNGLRILVGKMTPNQPGSLNSQCRCANGKS